MARKTHTKKTRSREAFLAARATGGAISYKTAHGTILLNVMKHFCYQKPYINDEYMSIMLYEIGKRRKAFASKGNEHA